MEIVEIDKAESAIRLLESVIEENPEATLTWAAQSLAAHMNSEGYVWNLNDALAAVLIVDLMKHFGSDEKAKVILAEGRQWLARRN